MQIELIDYGYITPPHRAHPNDAGYDVASRVTITVPAHTVVKIPLGFGIKLPVGFMANIYPRSGNSLKGLLPQLPPIDPGYTGEVHAILLNANSHDVTIEAGTKIGQLVFLPIYHFDIVGVVDMSRGANAFGSTDKHGK